MGAATCREPQVPRRDELAAELEAIFESSYDELFLADGRGVILRVNPACERLYGIPADQLVGKEVGQLEREGLFSPMSVVALAIREKRRVTVIQTGPSGRTLVATATPIFDRDGNVFRVVGNARDLTELMELRQRAQQAEEKLQTYQRELAVLRAELTEVHGIVATSSSMQKVLDLAKRVAWTDCTVLLEGESGVGKDLVARFIHRASQRRDGPFVKVNCGAIPETLLESELFGYEDGAFTGARRQGKSGLLEIADDGTLFLDEIADLPLALQVKLLQVIQERTFRRVGGTRDVQVNVRYIAATNQNLVERVAQGRFREDLYYRLKVVPIKIPPLRERKEDIPALVGYFLERAEQKYGTTKRISRRLMDVFQGYSWPGNVRELENIIERLVVTVEEETIDVHHLPEDFWARSNAEPVVVNEIVPLREAVEKVERELILRAWRLHRSTYKIARVLGISQPSALRKLRKYLGGTAPS